MVHSFLKAGF